MEALLIFGAANIVLTVIFWVLLILAAIGAFVPDATYPWITPGRWVLVLVLLAILGIAALGNPLSG